MTPLLIAALGAWLASTAYDAFTTLEVLKAGGGESNALLGEHPRPITVILFAILGAAVVTFVGLKYALPEAGPNVAAFFFAVASLVRVYAVVKNLKNLRKLQKNSIK